MNLRAGPPTPAVESTTEAKRALALAEPLLSRRPVETNILLSVLHERIARPEPGRYWVARRGGEVVGFALQSPLTFCAGLPPMPRDVAGVLADAIRLEVGQLPGVIGDAATAASFAGRWSEVTRDRVTPVEGQRIFRLGELRPASGVAGRLRAAGTADRGRLVSWWQEFVAATGNGGIGDPATAVDWGIADGRLFVWDDGGPCCMVRASPPQAGVSRIGIVYTPPKRRRHGYSAACVGALCAWVQEHDKADCMLYTQLANATSNGVYRRLGFVAVAEVLRYRFEQGA